MPCGALPFRRIFSVIPIALIEGASLAAFALILLQFEERRKHIL
jgi:hypothetical protein